MPQRLHALDEDLDAHEHRVRGLDCEALLELERLRSIALEVFPRHLLCVDELHDRVAQRFEVVSAEAIEALQSVD